VFKRFAWLWRFRRDEEEELERFERKLVELLDKGEISFPEDEEVEKFFEAQTNQEKVKGVVERCLRTLRERGVIKSV